MNETISAAVFRPGSDQTQEPDALETGIRTIERLERDIVALDDKLVLTSIAISLKRIADIMQAQQTNTLQWSISNDLLAIRKEINAYVAHNVPNHLRIY